MHKPQRNKNGGNQWKPFIWYMRSSLLETSKMLYHGPAIKLQGLPHLRALSSQLWAAWEIRHIQINLHSVTYLVSWNTGITWSALEKWILMTWNGMGVAQAVNMAASDLGERVSSRIIKLLLRQSPSIWASKFVLETVSCGSLTFFFYKMTNWSFLHSLEQ